MNKKKVYFLGDIHGVFKPIKKLYNQGLIEKDSVLVLLGDAGLNYFLDEKDTDVKKKLSELPLTYFIVRGNHEERPSLLMQRHPHDWKLIKFFGNATYVEKEFPNIHYALDSVAEYNINGHNTLIIPGAYSIDKFYRLKRGWRWFPQEMLTQKEMDEGLKILKPHYDLILSHTCAIEDEPTHLFISGVDQTFVNKEMEHYISKVKKQITYDVHLWGHYHKTEFHEGKPLKVMLYNDQAVELEILFKERWF